MKERCDNPNSSFYKNYGARGIGYDPRWSTFMPFYRDMGPRPVGLTLERVDTDADYSKENCIWGTWREQQNNRRNNIRVTLDGETLSLTQWCRLLDLDYSAVWARIRKLGWSTEDALVKPTALTFSDYMERANG